jgi:hypothetical protein
MLITFIAPDTELTARYLRGKPVIIRISTRGHGNAHYKTGRGTWKRADMTNAMNARSLAFARGVDVAEVE